MGVAVPLHPGDYLIFNELIPHCISSHCKLDDEIMCVSVYLKTSIVGMNNNDLALTSTQSIIGATGYSWLDGLLRNPRSGV